MSDSIKPWEGPWIDEEGRQCLGIWADEGGVILILREEKNGLSFHIYEGSGLVSTATMEQFRLPRITAFLDPAVRAATMPMRDLRKAP